MGETKRFSLKAVQASEQVGSGRVWVVMKALGNMGKVLISPLEDGAFKHKLEQVTEKIRRRESLKRNTDLPLTLLEEAVARAYFGTYIHDWDGFDDCEDRPFVFNEDNVAGAFVLGIPGVIKGKIPDLFDEVSGYVAACQMEHKERIAANLGNS